MNDIIIIAGSNNKNLALAHDFEKNLSELNFKTRLLDLVALDLPLYTPEAEKKGFPPQLHLWLEKFDSAKSFIFVTPEYNGGVPPALTNLIAWVSRSGEKDWRKYFNGKSAALASFSGSGGFQALISLRTQLSYLGFNVIGRQVRATLKEELKQDDVVAVCQLVKKSLVS